jgi:hypothetical protein
MSSSRKRKASGKVIFKGDHRREELENELFGGSHAFRSDAGEDDDIFIIADELRKASTSRVSRTRSC